MTKYTAEDFANARFAEHGTENDQAFRRLNVEGEPWKCECGGTWSDEDMVDMDWVPVPTKPTIMQSELRDKIKARGGSWANGYYAALMDLGAEITPDPKPTNAEKLAEIFRYAPVVNREDAIHGEDAIKAWAEYLANHGVKVED